MHDARQLCTKKGVCNAMDFMERTTTPPRPRPLALATGYWPGTQGDVKSIGTAVAIRRPLSLLPPFWNHHYHSQLLDQEVSQTCSDWPSTPLLPVPDPSSSLLSGAGMVSYHAAPPPPETLTTTDGASYRVCMGIFPSRFCSTEYATPASGLLWPLCSYISFASDHNRASLIICN